MPPRISLLGASRSLATRSRPSIGSFNPRLTSNTARRTYADSPATNTNQSGIGHVSEEAGDISKVKGETTPDTSQGTPVQDILERSEEGTEKAPKVIKEDIKDDKNATASASESDSVAQFGGEEYEETSFDNLLALGELDEIANGESEEGDNPLHTSRGDYLFEPTFASPWSPEISKENRYDPVVVQITNLLMRDGKKSVAQRNMSFILNTLRTAPPPIPNPARPLLPGAPHPIHLPLNPIGYLTLAIDSVAPLLRIRSQRGAAGGGAALQIPVPLGLRQRRRQAFMWILDAASKKQSRGSGRGMFAQRVADEIISVVEGRSSAWEKRLTLHKTGTTARSNLNFRGKQKRI